MCFHFNGVSFEKIKAHYRIAAPDDMYLLRDYEIEGSFYLNGFTHPYVPIITDHNEGVATIAEWGLLPGWAKDRALQKQTLNARIETVQEKPSFRNSASRRCLVPASSFYEWKWETPGKQSCKKTKFAIKPKGVDIFSFAGLYSVWQGTPTFTILTTDANDLMADIHNNKLRMPVVLKPEDEEVWLAKAPIEDFGLPYQVELEAVLADEPDPQSKLF